LLLTPPGWFAAFGAILGGAGSQALLPAAAAGILVTTALAWMAIRHLSAGYAERLRSLDEVKTRRRDAAGTPVGSRLDGVVRFWIRDPVERAAFGLAAAAMGRDRETKLRLYPSLAGILLVPIMAFLDSRHGSSGGRIFGLLGLGMVALLSVTVVETLRVSSQHAAADVFRMAPLESACGLFHGVRKAALFYVALPAGLAMATLIAFTFRGGRDGLVAGIPMILAIPTISLLPGVLGDYVPLSRPAVQGEIGSQAAVLMFGGMLVMGVLGVIGFLASRANLVVPVAAGELAILGLVHVAASKAIRSRPFPAD
jgi:hypothetical protein